MLFYIIIICLVLLIVFFTESRIFLALFQKAAFPASKKRVAFASKQQLFPESRLLENNWELFRDEFQKVMNGHKLPKFHQVDKLNNKISFDAGPAWRTVILKAYDGWFKSNCSLFPVTYGLLASMKNVSTIMYSVLEPGTLIPPHRGKLNGVFRYHLALQVPKTNDCFITINNVQYNWTEGEGVLFDDTYLHSVNNNSSEHRVVLFLDIKKKSNLLVETVNNMLLQLIVRSPIFRKGLKRGSIKID